MWVAAVWFDKRQIRGEGEMRIEDSQVIWLCDNVHTQPVIMMKRCGGEMNRGMERSERWSEGREGGERSAYVGNPLSALRR